jgi:hypothetical protein
MARTLEATVRDVVVRTRAGDQVAMALIAQARDQAKQGNKRAQVTVKAIDAFINKNPPSVMGVDMAPLGQKVNQRAVQAMWQAREWPCDLFGAMLAKAAPHVSMWHIIAVLVHGPEIMASDNLAKAAQMKGSTLGRSVRVAQRIKALQNPDVPISKYCKVTGWELGEIV